MSRTLPARFLSSDICFQTRLPFCLESSEREWIVASIRRELVRKSWISSALGTAGIFLRSSRSLRMGFAARSASNAILHQPELVWIHAARDDSIAGSSLTFIHPGLRLS